MDSSAGVPVDNGALRAMKPLTLLAAILLLLVNCSPPKQPEEKAKVEPTPAPEAKQKPVGRIVFGENYEEVDPASNDGRGFKIINPRDTFTPAEPFAFIVMCEEPFGKTKVELVLSSLSDTGSETVQARQEIQVANPTVFRNTAFRAKRASQSMGRYKFGRYKLRCFREDTLLAEGEFTYQKK